MANSNSSMFSLIKAYSLPFLLLSLAISFQLFVIPNSYPVSHYKVLGIDRYSSIEKVEEAYLKLSSQWNSSVEGRMTNDFIKVRYAFELLSNPLWKRDYDIFGIDEQSDVLARFKGQDAESFSKVELPLLKDSSSDLLDHPSNVLTAENFQSTVGLTGAWLIQVYSSGSKSCAEFHNSWKRIANLLDGVASTGMVELGEVPLATYLAEKKPTGEPFFRQGLPSLVALPAGCRNSDCFVRYYGDLSVDAVTDWFATDILGLPRILYYTKDILGQKFIAKSGPHKVKVICFSKTGERATPFLRQAAKNYWDYASFAFVLWQEEQSSLWWNTFEVESAPAVVFIKDPGVKPVVFHGAFNSSSFSQIMEQNKQQELPQLRSSTSLQLGCDSRGYSRAGNEINTWYCVILAGRLSPELNQMRETIRKTQDILLNEEQSSPLAASVALKDKRLTFTWLDGEAQKKYCFFYINSETSYETCGERRDIGDVPQIVILRYKRDDTQKKVNRKPKTVWDSFQEDDENLASQLVAKYNGSADISEITKWVSQIIEDGDSRDLPFFRTQTPNLVPEDADPMWARGAQSVVSTSKGMKQRIQNLLSRIYDWMGDPRTGPMLFLGAVLSFGGIWFNRNQPSKKPSQPSEARSEESEPSQSGPGGGTGGRIRRRRKSNVDQPSSITDVEPRDAYQALSSGSDTD